MGDEICTFLRYTDRDGKSLLHWVAQRAVEEGERSDPMNSSAYLLGHRGKTACDLLKVLLELAEANAPNGCHHLMYKKDVNGESLSLISQEARRRSSEKFVGGSRSG